MIITMPDRNRQQQKTKNKKRGGTQSTGTQESKTGKKDEGKTIGCNFTKTRYCPACPSRGEARLAGPRQLGGKGPSRPVCTAGWAHRGQGLRTLSWMPARCSAVSMASRPCHPSGGHTVSNLGNGDGHSSRGRTVSNLGNGDGHSSRGHTVSNLGNGDGHPSRGRTVSNLGNGDGHSSSGYTVSNPGPI